MFSTRSLPFALALLAALPGTAHATQAQAAYAAAPTVMDATGGADIARAKDGMFYVDAEINGQTVRFLVDTGANVVVLTAADAARLGLSAETDMFGPRMATAGGSAPMAWAKLDQVRLAGREVRGVKAAVVKSLPVSLLGQNMLSKLASVTIEGDRLRMR